MALFFYFKNIAYYRKIGRKNDAMKRKIGIVLAFLTLLFVLTPGLTINAHAAIVEGGSSLPALSTLEQTCAEIDAYLHGTQPATITCARTSSDPAAVPPPTRMTPCGEGTDDMAVIYVMQNGDHGSVCFNGRGYLGYRVNKVYEVFSPNAVNGWVLYYLPNDPKAAYYNLNANNSWILDFSGTQGDITQVDVGAQHAN